MLTPQLGGGGFDLLCFRVALKQIDDIIFMSLKITKMNIDIIICLV